MRGIRRQGIGSVVRNCYVSPLRPVVIGPSLVHFRMSLRGLDGQGGAVYYITVYLMIYQILYIYIYINFYLFIYLFKRRGGAPRGSQRGGASSRGLDASPLYVHFYIMFLILIIIISSIIIIMFFCLQLLPSARNHDSDNGKSK